MPISIFLLRAKTQKILLLVFKQAYMPTYIWILPQKYTIIVTKLLKI